MGSQTRLLRTFRVLTLAALAAGLAYPVPSYSFAAVQGNDDGPPRGDEKSLSAQGDETTPLDLETREVATRWGVSEDETRRILNLQNDFAEVASVIRETLPDAYSYASWDRSRGRGTINLVETSSNTTREAAANLAKGRPVDVRYDRKVTWQALERSNENLAKRLKKKDPNGAWTVRLDSNGIGLTIVSETSYKDIISDATANDPEFKDIPVKQSLGKEVHTPRADVVGGADLQ